MKPEERWVMMVFVHVTNTGVEEWRAVKPSGYPATAFHGENPEATPYLFDTREKALEMLKMLYPDGWRAHRQDFDAVLESTWRVMGAK